MMKLSCGERADISAAGPLANIWFGGFLWLACAITNLGFELFHPPHIYNLLMYAGIPAGLFFARKIFSRYMFFPLGLAAMGLLMWTIFHHPQQMSGPVDIAKMIGHTHTALTAFILAINISFSLAIFNAIPLLPLDGGTVPHMILGRFGVRVQGFYERLSLLLVALLFGYITLSDFWK